MLHKIYLYTGSARLKGTYIKSEKIKKCSDYDKDFYTVINDNDTCVTILTDFIFKCTFLIDQHP